MSATKKAKITFTCEPSLKDALEKWAIAESRTLSNLMEILARQGYANYSENRPENNITKESTPTAKPAVKAATKQKQPKAKNQKAPST